MRLWEGIKGIRLVAGGRMEKWIGNCIVKERSKGSYWQVLSEWEQMFIGDIVLLMRLQDLILSWTFLFISAQSLHLVCTVERPSNQLTRLLE